MRAILISATLAVAAIGAPLTAEAIAKHYNLNIPRQPLDSALKDFAQQTGLQIARLVEKETAEETVGPVLGDVSAEYALTALLAPAGLQYRVVNERTIAVVDASKQPGRATLADAGNAQAGRRADVALAGQDAKRTRKTSFWDPFRLAQVDEGQAAGNERAEKSGVRSEREAATLEEIVVTAQKREERLQEVPVPVSAVDANSLVESNQLRLQDYYARIPGLTVTPQAVRGAPLLAIRGITAGEFGNPTVGITVDEVPFGSSTYTGGGYISPEIDPSDLSRIEVLRGPQGTLYGVASLGGLIKYVTVDPSTDALTSRVQVGTNSVENGDGLGYSARASVNVPLGDSFAVRVSGFTRRDSGFVDNVRTGQDGVNRGDAHGGRLGALWRISDTFSVKLSALLQDYETHGSPLAYVQPDLGDLEQAALRGTGGTHRKTHAYSANIAAKLGSIDLTSITGYGANSNAFSIDFFGLNFFNPLSTHKFTQEIRLSAPIGQRLEWQLGAFYTDEDSTWISNVYTADAASGELIENALLYRNPTAFKEYAAYGNLTVHLTDRLDVQFGGRESRNEQTSSAISIPGAPFGGGPPVVTPETDSRYDAFTYLVTPRFRLSEDVMLYARLASGYRAGGPNANFVLLGAPSQYGPDKTRNYDIGVKASFLNRRLSVDTSVYYIDWNDIQVSLAAANGSTYVENAGKGKSQGVELALEARPAGGFTVAANATWSDATLTEDFPLAANIPTGSGERLPFSSRFSGSLSLDEEFALAGSVTAFVGGRVSYIGNRIGNFISGSTVRQRYPSYATTDLRAGVRFDTWTANLYANNLGDRRGILAGGLDSLPTNSYSYIQPRTIGVSLTKAFE